MFRLVHQALLLPFLLPSPFGLAASLCFDCSPSKQDCEVWRLCARWWVRIAGGRDGWIAHTRRKGRGKAHAK